MVCLGNTSLLAVWEDWLQWLGLSFLHAYSEGECDFFNDFCMSRKKKSCSLKTRYLYFSWGTAFLLSLINPEGIATIALYLGPALMCLQLLSIPLNNWFFYSFNLFGCCCIILSYLIFTILCWTDTHGWISYMLMSHLFELIEKCLVEHFPFNKW